MKRFIQDQAVAIVRERDRRRIRAMAGVLYLSGVLVVGVLGYVWFQVQRVRLSYELEDLRSLRADVEEQNRKLHLEIASLRAFARVDSAARRLGLTQPTADQIQMAREFLADDRPGASARTAAQVEAMTTTRRRP
ncbi:MAG TPA: cell division protein FtsL [Methylomirabilota bacterium]|nr:cell division protein FtsL [Methylomirabilota bacterium]